MLLMHLIVVIIVILVFCFIIQYAANLYIYRKLHNQGADEKTSKIIAQNMSILLAVFYGILIFILVCIAVQTFDGGVII